MPIITLTTDYGLKDHFVGALKGKILSEYPDASIVDISHSIDPFNIVETSYILESACHSFPKGTVHLVGVDVELRRDNKHIAMLWNGHYFVTADNGVLDTFVKKSHPQQLVTIDIHNKMPDGSTDMDVLVRVACHLAKGGLLSEVGKETETISELNRIQAVAFNDNKSIKGNVIYIDHFGNAVTNITKQYFAEIGNGRAFEIVIKNDMRNDSVGGKITKVYSNYSAIMSSDKYPLKDYEGKKMAVFNEGGVLEIAIFRSNPEKVGSASSLLDLKYWDSVTVHFL